MLFLGRMLREAEALLGVVAVTAAESSEASLRFLPLRCSLYSHTRRWVLHLLHVVCVSGVLHFLFAVRQAKQLILLLTLGCLFFGLDEPSAEGAGAEDGSTDDGLAAWVVACSSSEAEPADEAALADEPLASRCVDVLLPSLSVWRLMLVSACCPAAAANAPSLWSASVLIGGSA